MSTPNSLFVERIAVPAVLGPQTISNTTVDSEYALGSDFGRVAFVASIGTIDAATTVDVSLLEATDSSGTGAQALTGKAATQLTATDDNKQVVLEVASSELTDGFTHVACRVTVTGSTADAYWWVWGSTPALSRQAPAMPVRSLNWFRNSSSAPPS